MDIASLIPLLERTNQVAANREPSRLLEETLTLLKEVCGAGAGALYLLDEHARVLVCRAGDDTVLGARQDVKDSLSREALLQNRPVSREGLQGGKFQRLVSLPLRAGGDPLGVVYLFNFTQPEFDLAQLLADRMSGEIGRVIELEASRERNQRLESLIAILGQIGSSLDRDRILRVIIDSVPGFLSAEACSLFLTDPAAGDLVLAMASNVDKRIHVEQMHVPAGKGIIGHVVQTGETVLVADTSQDERHYNGMDRQSGFVTRSILAIPLCTRTVDLGTERGVSPESIIGGLEVLNKLQGTFSDDDARMLQILSNQAATVLEIAGLYTDTNELFLDVIGSLTAAIDAKDPYTEGHSQRVSEFSVEIARELGLPAETIHHVRIGSLLHDVGKIGIPDAILAKPEELTEAEFELVKQHPAIGARIMSKVRMLLNEMPMLSEHQERLDGSGYPQGLKDEQISLTSRIVAVADVFDALTSDRPYHKASTPEEALEYLRSLVDKHFDRDCVEALARAYQRHAIRTAGKS